jgi:S-sulfo-L-cysteine synthase (O-acetyl-L-serine-dependent)
LPAKFAAAVVLPVTGVSRRPLLREYHQIQFITLYTLRRQRSFFLIPIPMITEKSINRQLVSRVRSLGRQIGHTPLHPFSYLQQRPAVTILAKKEWMQLSGSIKARAAYSIMLHAIENGELHADRVLLDATSGNTGIAYATIAQKLGLRTTLCLPENASSERKAILTGLGAHILFTSKFEGTDGAQEMARNLAAAFPEKYFYANQYKNNNNWKAHYNGTAPELFTEIPGITHFVAGLGTTGTFTGTARRLKLFNPKIKTISLQPSSALHGLEGWKHLETAVVPAFHDPTLADEVIEIDTQEAWDIIKRVKKAEGWLLSPSAAANIAGALKISQYMNSGVVVTVLPDNAEKYPETIKQVFSNDNA